MSVPPDLPDIGSTAQRLCQNPRFDPLSAGIGPEEYFVWTRFDGATTLRDLIVMTGFDTLKAVEIVRKLRSVGAILLPGENPPPRATTPPPVPVVVIQDDLDLPTEERTRILAMHERIHDGDSLSILGVSERGDKKAIKRAYFQLSKEFHPDRYYGRRTGPFAAKLEEIFEAIASAYAELSDEGSRRRPTSTPSAPTADSNDHAAQVFERACQAEVSGDLAGALRLFAQALRLDGATRYLRRASRCALAAGDVRTALEYAKKAANLEPNDPSTARLLAHAFKAAGKLADAEETLVLALMIKTENDQLSHELQHDLAEVRRLSTR